MGEDLLKSMGKINAEMDSWRNSWEHKNPCKEWEEHKRIHGHGFCKHLVEARHKKFGKRIELILDELKLGGKFKRRRKNENLC